MRLPKQSSVSRKSIPLNINFYVSLLRGKYSRKVVRMVRNGNMISSPQATLLIFNRFVFIVAEPYSTLLEATIYESGFL